MTALGSDRKVAFEIRTPNRIRRCVIREPLRMRRAALPSSLRPDQTVTTQDVADSACDGPDHAGVTSPQQHEELSGAAASCTMTATALGTTPTEGTAKCTITLNVVGCSTSPCCYVAEVVDEPGWTWHDGTEPSWCISSSGNAYCEFKARPGLPQ